MTEVAIYDPEGGDEFVMVTLQTSELAPLPGETLGDWWERFNSAREKNWDPDDPAIAELIALICVVARHLMATYDVTVMPDPGGGLQFRPRGTLQ